MLKYLKQLTSQSSWIILLIVFLWMIMVGYLDYLANISLGIFYLFSIVLATWTLGKTAGLIVSLLSTIAGFGAEFQARQSENLFLIEWDALVRLAVFVVITFLLEEMRQAYQSENHLARTDALTGLWNRLYFLELLEREIMRFQREPRPFTLVYIEIDNWKTVDDTCGDSQKDQLFLSIAKVLTHNLRQIDSTARLGGDKFALLLFNTNQQTAHRVLLRIQLGLLEIRNGDSFSVGFSTGALTFERLPGGISEVLERVEQLMYEAKRQGKNQIKHQVYQ